MKTNRLRTMIRGLSFTSVMFVFQACYGPPQDFGMDVLIEGQVRSLATGHPIPGIKVSVPDRRQYEYTNEEGRFSLFTEVADSYALRFEDIDSSLNGRYATQDTVITAVVESVDLDIVLNEE